MNCLFGLGGGCTSSNFRSLACRNLCYCMYAVFRPEEEEDFRQTRYADMIVMRVSYFPLKVMYDHRPSPKGSWPFPATQEVHLSTTAVKVPPGWWPEEKFSSTCDWAKDENCHILWNQRVAWNETWFVQLSFVSTRLMAPIPNEWHRARLYWNSQSVLPGCRPFGFWRIIRNILEVSISSITWPHVSSSLDNE